MKRKKISNLETGFTLIELMLVIALMAMLISFALPSYQNYLQRTQIAEGFTLATPLQMAISEYFYETGQAPQTLEALGLPHPPQGRYVKTLTLEQGTLVIHYGNQANASLNEKTLRLTPYLNPDQSLLWRCQASPLPSDATLMPSAQDTPRTTDLPSNLLPQTCRTTERSL